MHFDLRLEHNGVNADFEGLIPEGNYGAGAMIVWDRGAYVPLIDMDEGFENGKLLFEMRGHKLRGTWTLIKIKKAEKEWLLIKERDAYASTDPDVRQRPHVGANEARVRGEVSGGHRPDLLVALGRLKER